MKLCTGSFVINSKYLLRTQHALRDFAAPFEQGKAQLSFNDFEIFSTVDDHFDCLSGLYLLFRFSDLDSASHIFFATRKLVLRAIASRDGRSAPNIAFSFKQGDCCLHVFGRGVGNDLRAYISSVCCVR
jgi:hypothetical protein